ncbi:MAG: hypothetical protein Q8Q49_05975 [bacterium]|nr:hypothetical protein [bacterium]
MDTETISHQGGLWRNVKRGYHTVDHAAEKATKGLVRATRSAVSDLVLGPKTQTVPVFDAINTENGGIKYQRVPEDEPVREAEPKLIPSPDSVAISKPEVKLPEPEMLIPGKTDADTARDVATRQLRIREDHIAVFPPATAEQAVFTSSVPTGQAAIFLEEHDLPQHRIEIELIAVVNNGNIFDFRTIGTTGPLPKSPIVQLSNSMTPETPDHSVLPLPKAAP